MKNHQRKYSMSGTVNSGGSASLNIDFLGGNFSEEERLHAFSDVLTKTAHSMINKGQIRLMSASDISENYGRSRQFWEKLIRQGKIPYQQTKSGKITTNIWVEGYLNDSESYGSNVAKMRETIIEFEDQNGLGHGTIKCEKCKNETFHYYYNNGNYINGSCTSSGCHFRIDTQI